MLTPEEAATVAIASFTSRALTPAQLAAEATIARILSSPDPHIADLPGLFAAFQTLYFRSLLPRATCSVSWSPRMTFCAGTCTLAASTTATPRSVSIRLSEPLLRYRPRSDAVNTLLHEGIHGYLFMCSDHRRSDDPSGHGSDFQRVAAAVNAHGGYNVTVTHEFHDEVESYRRHVWRCDGPCRERAPFYGEVRRAMDRRPGKSDPWWKEHEETCGGKWKKVAGPKGWGSIEKWVKKAPPPPSPITENGTGKRKRDGREDAEKAEKRSRNGGHETEPKGETDIAVPDDDDDEAPTTPKQRKQDADPLPTEQTGGEATRVPPPDALVDCPVCPARVGAQDINHHLDNVHGFGAPD